MKNVTDEQIREVYAREASALREDVQEAKALYRKIGGEEYISGKPQRYDLPKENIFNGVDSDIYRGILLGAVVFAQREVYGAALGSQVLALREIGERHAQRVSRLTAESVPR